MQINYKIVQSATKPAEIDVLSSPNGVYIRRNIKEIKKEAETESDVKTLFEYQEAFLNMNEWEQYSSELLVNNINGEDNTAEYEEYKRNLNSGVQYINGKHYKPIWADLYNKKVNDIMQMLNNYEKLGGDVSGFYNTKILITDVTNKAENFVLMTPKEIIELWFFLLQKQEQYFQEYKKAVENSNLTT